MKICEINEDNQKQVNLNIFHVNLFKQFATYIFNSSDFSDIPMAKSEKKTEIDDFFKKYPLFFNKDIKNDLINLWKDNLPYLITKSQKITTNDNNEEVFIIFSFLFYNNRSLDTIQHHRIGNKENQTLQLSYKTMDSSTIMRVLYYNTWFSIQIRQCTKTKIFGLC